MNQFRLRSQNRVVLASFIVVAILALGVGTWFYFNPQGGNSGRLESVKVVYAKFESLALFWVAEDQGFFIQNGLNVTSQPFASGVAALDALVNGEADVALGIAEFPLVGKALLKEEVSAFGSLDKADFVYLVCRKDREIANVSDLIGKRVGIVSGTIAEFYLGRFLELHGMSLQDLTLVDVRTPEEWVNSIVNGDIDAISIAQPSVNAIVDKLGTNAVVWPVQSNQQMYSLMISSDDWIAEHPELITRFLNSLLQAEEFVQDHPTEAKAIVKKQMNFSDEYMETVWKQNQYSLSLDQSLIVAMEDEARWMIKNNLTNENNVPDFLDYVYVEGLESLKPEAVNIVR